MYVLVQQPEVDPKRISIIGHSEGTFIAPLVAIDNPGKVINIVLIGSTAHLRDITYFQRVYLPILYTIIIMDQYQYKKHLGIPSFYLLLALLYLMLVIIPLFTNYYSLAKL